MLIAAQRTPSAGRTAGATVARRLTVPTAVCALRAPSRVGGDFLAAAFLAVVFLAVFLAVVFLAARFFGAGPLARFSASSSAARSIVTDSTASALRRVALVSPSVT